MKTKKIFAFLLAFALVLGLAGCVTTEPTTQGPEKQSVSEVLAAPQNNTEVYVEGTVFAVAPHGYYMSDGTQGIYVFLGSAATPTCTVGQKLEVKAKLSYVSKFPQLINVTSEEAVTTDTEISAIEKEITEINALNKDAVASYACYFLVTGTLAKDEAGSYYLSDDEGNKLFFDATSSNVEVLETQISHRIQIPVVTYKNATSWLVSFCGTATNITDKTRTVADYQEIITADLDNRVAKEIYGAINLPSGHKVLTFLQYTWSVKEETSVITFENGAAKVAYNDQDNNVTLVCSFQVGEETGTVEYPIVSKAIVERSVKELLDNQPAVNMSVVKVRGIVSALTHNQSKSLYSIVIQDKTEPTQNGVFIDFASNATSQQLFKVGDEIVITAYYRNLLSGDRPCMQAMNDADGKLDATKYEIVSQNNQVNTNPALIVDSEEKYNELASNYFNYIGRIVTFINPYAAMNKALSASTYIDLGHNETTKQYAMASGATLTFGFVTLGSSDENFGSGKWYSYFGIDTTTKQSGMIVSCIPGYYDAGGHSQLMVVNSESVKPYDEAKVVDFKLECTVEAGSKTQFTLPATVGDVAITWTSSDPTVVSNEGIIQGVQAEEKEVTLTASYKLSEEGETLTKAIKVLVLVDKIYTVSELAAKEASEVEYVVQGQVVGFASQHGGSYRGNGVLISDGTNVLLIGTYPVFTFTAKDDVAGRNTYKYNDTAIAIGDIVRISHVTVTEAGCTIALSSESQLEWVTDGTPISTTAYDYPVIDSKEDLTAFMASVTATGSKTASSRMVKLVGTDTNPIYVGAMNGYGLALYFLGAEDSTIAAMVYPVGYTTSKSSYMIIVPTLLGETLGAQWLAANTPYSIDWTQSYGAAYTKTTDATLKTYALKGEIVLMVEYTGTASYPYVYMNPVSAGCTLEIIPSQAYAESLIAPSIPSEAGSSVTDLSGFNMITAGGIFESISYESNNAAIDLTLGTITHGNEAVEVTITVTYKLVGGTDNLTYTKKVTVSPDGTPTYQRVIGTLGLAAGDKVVFVIKSGDKYYALSSDNKTGVEVTIDNNGYLVINSNVGFLDVIASTTSGHTDAFAFKNSAGKYLVAGGKDGNHSTIGFQNSCSANTSYDVETQGTGAEATTNLDVRGTNANCYIEYNSTTGQFQRTATFGDLMIFKFVLVK